MRARPLVAMAAAVALIVPISAAASSGIPKTRNAEGGAVDTPIEADEGLLPGGDHQHGEVDGHLPPSSANVELVGFADLTDLPGGIADVGTLGKFAYLNAWAPECVEEGGNGTGVHVVDISDPANPTKVGFIPAHRNSFPGEGIHVIHMETASFSGDLLVHNNEPCDSSLPFKGGVSLWDVTNPLRPKPLAAGVGDSTPALSPNLNGVHHVHSAFAWFVPETGRAYVMMADNQETVDVDILDITDPSNPVFLSEVGFADWPDALSPLANGDTVFNHDFQVKKIGADWLGLISYWDAGWVILNLNDPANPVFVDDFDYPTPDSLTGFDIPEGNAHQGWWSTNNQFFIGTDEDFSPARTSCTIDTGVNAGPTGCGEFGFSVPIQDNFPGGLSGTTVWGGSGCEEDVDANGTGDRDEVLASFTQAQTGADIIVFSRGTCFFSTKIETGELAGYNAVIIGNSHVGSRNGLVPDAFLCGGQGSPVLGIASAICIGHRAMHQLFDDTPEFIGAEVIDLPTKGTAGHDFSATGGVFDGWGYVRLVDAHTLEEIDAYAVAEGLDPAFASGFGNLTVHEVQTDPRRNSRLAYLSYYAAGFRVVRFGTNGIQEVGHFIAEGGNDFWGIEPTQALNPRGRDAPLLLLSDRDSGLWIFRYTGS